MIDTTSLFLHVLAAVGLVGGGIVQVMAGARVRSATTGAEMASWARFTRNAGLLIAGSAVLSLLTGGHLAGAVWTTEETSGFSYPFITLGVVGLLLLAPVGPMVGGARLRRLVGQADALGDAPVGADVRAQATAPGLWGPIHSLVGVGVGFIALMTYKPESWLVGALLLLIGFAAGWVAGSAAASSARQGSGQPA